MSNAIETQIKERISAFVQELDLMVRKATLESLQGILSGGGAAPVRRGPGRPAGVRRAPRARGRRPADLGDATTKVIEHVRANDGQGISAIAEATGLDLKVAKKAAIQLLAAGALKKSGQKRGTVYHVGSGRPVRAGKAKRGARKAKRAAKPRRKVAARRKPSRPRSRKRTVVVTPARRRSASKPGPTRRAVATEVPEALAVAE